MLNTKSFISCLVAVSVLLSCNKNDSYDVKGDTMVKFFTNNMSSGNAPQNSINYNVVNIPDVAGSAWINLSTNLPDTIKFPVFATKPAIADVAISATLDNSLIAEYNAAHNTNYVAFPDGILKTNGLAAHFRRGSTISSDSIYIPADKGMLSTLTEKAYMAPVRLSTVSNPDVGEIVSTTGRITYIVAGIELRRIKFNAVAAEAIGTLISPRTSWTIVFTPAPSTISGSGSVLDGSTSSYSRWGASPVQVDLNLQADKNVTGIRLYTSSSSTYIPAQTEVYLSSDGINYDPVGVPLKANLTFASSYNYILFYKPIPAKFIRLKLYYSTSTSSNNFRLAELDVYAN